MEICVCVKRVPMVGGVIVVAPDGLDVDTSMAGFTVSPHEECGVEEAVRITERMGGSVTVLTLGPPQAADQLRDMLALGASRAILLQTDGAEWGAVATAAAVADAVRERGFDLLVFGNEAADTGGYQVPVRVAHVLGRPCVTGVKRLEVVAGAGAGAGAGGSPERILAGREYAGAEETFDLPLPAVVSVKEGINLPRYPSLPGRLRAKRATIEVVELEPRGVPGGRPPGLAPRPPDGLVKQRLRVPAGSAGRSELLGSGAEAVPALVRLFDDLGVLR